MREHGRAAMLLAPCRTWMRRGAFLEEGAAITACLDYRPNCRGRDGLLRREGYVGRVGRLRREGWLGRVGRLRREGRLFQWEGGGETGFWLKGGFPPGGGEAGSWGKGGFPPGGGGGGEGGVAAWASLRVKSSGALYTTPARASPARKRRRCILSSSELRVGIESFMGTSLLERFSVGEDPERHSRRQDSVSVYGYRTESSPPSRLALFCSGFWLFCPLARRSLPSIARFCPAKYAVYRGGRGNFR